MLLERICSTIWLHKSSFKPKYDFLTKIGTMKQK